MTERSVIDSREGYLAAVEAIAAGDGPLAVDAERASGFRYSQRAYLIQVFRRGSGVFLFDPPAIGDFTELQAVMAPEEWVLHAASQDLACLREVGLDPERIFDTELAARLLGMPRVGLATVVEEKLGVVLRKEHSAADWSTRPLPESWLEYAALDVELLVDVRDALEADLAAAGKTDIARQEFEATLARPERAARVDPWRRLSGIHAVRGGRGLSVARELWEERDALARELDVAPGRLIPDASIVAAVRSQPASMRALAAQKDFSGRASRSEIERWWAAIERGRTLSDPPVTRGTGEAMPPPRAWAERNPEADARLKAARPAVVSVAEQLNLPVENLLTPDFLRRLAWTPPDPATPETIAEVLVQLGARPWQIDATAQTIADAFVAARQTRDDTESDPS
ncbi:ribonuclease D [Labedella populi]|uniref:Ribonuclease D n=1 Tax=Labedella populi TaxID=2498850 RepID=A0A3S4E1T9_9MICO|nr:HRDC domain-containing protein [Labedella populi]RWZ61430.1 ribonuclease D [Labedella populi]